MPSATSSRISATTLPASCSPTSRDSTLPAAVRARQSGSPTPVSTIAATRAAFTGSFPASSTDLLGERAATPGQLVDEQTLPLDVDDIAAGCETEDHHHGRSASRRAARPLVRQSQLPELP